MPIKTKIAAITNPTGPVITAIKPPAFETRANTLITIPTILTSFPNAISIGPILATKAIFLSTALSCSSLMLFSLSASFCAHSTNCFK